MLLSVLVVGFKVGVLNHGRHRIHGSRRWVWQEGDHLDPRLGVSWTGSGAPVTLELRPGFEGSR